MSVSRRGDGFCWKEYRAFPMADRHVCALSDTHTHDHQCCCGFEWPRTEDDD